jgi:RNA-directed DNA polymerase
MNATKSFDIPKQLVMNAYKAVKANAGAAGIDEQSIKDFEKNLKDNLYKIWNRMSSGTYFPPPVKAVAIPKKSGGTRLLGIPTVADRIAQAVVRMVLEENIEPIFLADSYGYRPRKSALDAVGETRKRCWNYDWVLEFDIKGMFDNIDHELLMRAVSKHTECRWIILYIERWLKVPMQMPDGTQVERTKGTPQGGVISPLLANLFMHYVFDVWITKKFSECPWCRYADDGVVHCKTKQQAQVVQEALARRLEECKLELHPDKTRIVYCKDANRTGNHPNTELNFLGYTFRPRVVMNSKTNTLFISFTAAVSRKAQTAMRQKIRKTRLRNRSDFELEDIARIYNPILRGWDEYYGKYHPTGMVPVFKHFNRTLVAWAMHKYKRLKRHKSKAALFIKKQAEEMPKLFIHWQKAMVRATT